MFEKKDNGGKLPFLTEPAMKYIIKLIVRLTDPKTQERKAHPVILIPSSWEGKVTSHDVVWMQNMGVGLLVMSGFKDRWGVTLLRDEEIEFLLEQYNEDADKIPQYSPNGFSRRSMENICILIPE